MGVIVPDTRRIMALRAETLALPDIRSDVMPDNRPVIAVTMGDPAGIGPEICVKALGSPGIYHVARPLLIGSAGMISHYTNLIRPDIGLNLVRRISDLRSIPGIIDLLCEGDASPASVNTGQISPGAGRAALRCINTAVRLCLCGEANAMATAPVNKESLLAGGSRFIDHTAILEDATGHNATTMFEVGALRVFFLTRHVSLLQSIKLLSKARVEEGIRLMVKNLQRIGVSTPRVAVAALNPHAGEGGLFGEEEQAIISPAVEASRASGIDVVGPVAADAVFSLGLAGKFDAVLSLYHDQGHIATKTYDFERTVSVTLGLPFVRTSVDHGTALDIAGKGITSEVSLIQAIKSAAKYAHVYRL